MTLTLLTCRSGLRSSSPSTVSLSQSGRPLQLTGNRRLPMV